MFNWLLSCFPHGHRRNPRSPNKDPFPLSCFSYADQDTSKAHPKNSFDLRCSDASIVRDGNFNVKASEGAPAPSRELVSSQARRALPSPPSTFNTWREWVEPMSTIWEEPELRPQLHSQTSVSCERDETYIISLRRALLELEATFSDISDKTEAETENEDVWMQVGNESNESDMNGVMVETRFGVSWITGKADKPVVERGVRKLV